MPEKDTFECPECTEEVYMEDNFCFNCGTKFEGMEEAEDDGEEGEDTGEQEEESSGDESHEHVIDPPHNAPTPSEPAPEPTQPWNPQ